MRRLISAMHAPWKGGKCSRAYPSAVAVPACQRTPARNRYGFALAQALVVRWRPERRTTGRFVAACGGGGARTVQAQGVEVDEAVELELELRGALVLSGHLAAVRHSPLQRAVQLAGVGLHRDPQRLASPHMRGQPCEGATAQDRWQRRRRIARAAATPKGPLLARRRAWRGKQKCWKPGTSSHTGDAHQRPRPQCGVYVTGRARRCDAANKVAHWT